MTDAAMAGQNMSHGNTTTGPSPGGPVVFIGDSLMEWGRWGTAFPGVSVANLGQCGDTTAGLLHRYHAVFGLDPARVFVMIGAGDLAYGVPVQVVLRNYDHLLGALRDGLPDTPVYVHSLLPNRHGAWGVALASVHRVNGELPAIAKKHRCEYLDIHGEFTDDEGHLRAELTDDGLHLSPAGYRLWEGLIREYVE